MDRKTFLIVPCLLLLIGMLLAQSPGRPAADADDGTITALDLTGLPNGKYVLDLTDTEASLVPLRLLSPGPIPPGPVPPVPPSPTLTERAKAIQSTAIKVTSAKRSETAQMLAALYDQWADQVAKGQLKNPEAIAFAVKFSTDTLLVGRDANAWQPVRDLLSEQWAAVLQAGGAEPELAKLLSEAADGLNASSPNAQAIDLETIMRIVMMVLELLMKLFPTAIAAP